MAFDILQAPVAQEYEQVDRPILAEFPERLVGKRIVVRPFDEADADELFAAIQQSKEHVRPWLPWYDKHQTVEDTLEFIRRTRADIMLRESFGLGVFERETGRFLGGAGLHVHSWSIPSFEIGYWVRVSEEGKGYVSEAARLLTTLAFEQLGAQRVVIRCDTRNIRSRAVPERLGYQLEGTFRNDMRDTAGELRDTAVYSMIPEDYRRAREVR